MIRGRLWSFSNCNKGNIPGSSATHLQRGVRLRGVRPSPAQLQPAREVLKSPVTWGRWGLLPSQSSQDGYAHVLDVNWFNYPNFVDLGLETASCKVVPQSYVCLWVVNSMRIRQSAFPSVIEYRHCCWLFSTTVNYYQRIFTNHLSFCLAIACHFHLHDRLSCIKLVHCIFYTSQWSLRQVVSIFLEDTTTFHGQVVAKPPLQRLMFACDATSWECWRPPKPKNFWVERVTVTTIADQLHPK